MWGTLHCTRAGGRKGSPRRALQRSVHPGWAQGWGWLCSTIQAALPTVPPSFSSGAPTPSVTPAAAGPPLPFVNFCHLGALVVPGALPPTPAGPPWGNVTLAPPWNSGFGRGGPAESCSGDRQALPHLGAGRGHGALASCPLPPTPCLSFQSGKEAQPPPLFLVRSLIGCFAGSI